MEKTWKPVVAGILNIVSGAFSFVVLALLILGVIVFAFAGDLDLPMRMGPAFLSVIAVPLLAAEILAIVGGIFSLKRVKWGWVLAGSIAALFLVWPLAIAAIVLTVLSMNEFEKTS